MTTVLVGGATGMLGHRIAAHLLDQDGVAVRLMVRDGWQAEPSKSAGVGRLVARGATVATADLLSPETLDAATSGVDVVVSALQGGEDVIVAGQVALARAGVRAGVRRFIPSDFAIDLFRAPAGAPQFEARKRADAAIEALGLEVLNVLSGGFMDLMVNPTRPGLVDVSQKVVHFWGTGDEVFDLTTVEDTAAFTARLATDDSAAAGVHTISGGQVSFNQVADEVSRVTGVRIRATSWGSIDELKRVITAKGGPGSWDAAMEWYFAGVLTAPLLANVENERYAGLEPLGLRGYLEEAHRAA